MSILFMVSCTSTNDNSIQEVIIKNIPSLDKQVNAVITKYSYGGATGSFVYKLYLKQYDTNDNISKLKPLLVAEKVENIALKWTSINILVLDISSERIMSFKNYWWNYKRNINYYIKINGSI